MCAHKAIKSRQRKRTDFQFKGKPLHRRREVPNGEILLDLKPQSLRPASLTLQYNKKEKIMQNQSTEVPRRKRKKGKQKKNDHYIWAVKVFLISIVITAFLSFVSGEMLERLNVYVAFVVLVVFILLGIIFDIIGLAVATAIESPFHSMAAQRNVVGKTAVKLLKNAEKVSSFCNDVVGDICGVVSGATGTAIAASLFNNSKNAFWWTLLLTSAVAAFIVGGKALGKRLAMQKSVEIVTGVSKVLCVFKPRRKHHNQ